MRLTVYLLCKGDKSHWSYLNLGMPNSRKIKMGCLFSKRKRCFYQKWKWRLHHLSLAHTTDFDANNFKKYLKVYRLHLYYIYKHTGECARRDGGISIPNTSLYQGNYKDRHVAVIRTNSFHRGVSWDIDRKALTGKSTGFTG